MAKEKINIYGIGSSLFYLENRHMEEMDIMKTMAPDISNGFQWI